MTVNTGTWHYHLLNWAYAVGRGTLMGTLAPWWLWDELRDPAHYSTVRPPNLCSYFWAVLFVPGYVLVLSYLFLFAWVVSLVAFALFYLFRWLYLGASWSALGVWNRAARARGHVPQAVTYKQSLLWEFLKARKQKVCPIISYEAS